MTWLIGLASIVASAYIYLAMNPFESNIANVLCCVGLSAVFMFLLCKASDIEEKFEKRIKKLEYKLEQNSKERSE